MKIKVGPYTETISLIDSHVVVTYEGPPMPPEIAAELQAYWGATIERITREIILGTSAYNGLGSPLSGGPAAAPQGSGKGPPAHGRGAVPAGILDYFAKHGPVT